MKPPDNAFIWLDIAKIDAFRLAGDTKEKKSISKVIFVSGVRGYAVEAFEHACSVGGYRGWKRSVHRLLLGQ